MDLNLRPDQETPDIDYSEDPMEIATPDINFTENEENETPELNFDEPEAVQIDRKRFETEESDIDDLDEPDQYVEGDDIDASHEEDNENHSTTDRKKTKEKSMEPRGGKRLLSLPSARVKQIMKTDPDVTLITGECTFLVAKATELFIESLAREAFLHTAQSKKKTVQKRDVDTAIENVDALMFLEGMMNG